MRCEPHREELSPSLKVQQIKVAVTQRTFAMLDIPVLVRSLKSSSIGPVCTWMGSASGEKSDAVAR